MIWLPEGEGKGVEMLLEEIMAENLPNLENRQPDPGSPESYK